MGNFSFISFLFFTIIIIFFFNGTEQLQTSQTQLLYQLRIQLEYPKPLEIWSTFNGDFCYSPQSPNLNLTCENNFITELKITGDLSSSSSSSSTITEFDGIPILNQTLSSSFSIDSFVTTLSRLSSLRVLTLVSLGIWGSLPDKIHRLSSLQSLDLSSNFLYGSIPPRMSTMLNLRILRLDDNFFNSTVPSWIDLLSNLTIFSVKSNQLRGAIPLSVIKLRSLEEFSVSSNRISGKLFDLSNLTSLHVLDLRDNRIDSGLPIMPKGLVLCFLSKNSFSGEIPEEFVGLSQLQQLDLSFNFLQGKPPALLFSLPNISYLNLASNMLSGSLPKNLDCSNALGFVDISTNRLSGELPSCLSSTWQKRVKFGGNCLSVDPQHQNNASYCKIKETRRVSRGKSLVVLVGAIGGVVLLLLSVALAVFYRRYCRRRTSDMHLLAKTAQDKPPTVFPPEFFANARFISQTTKLSTQGIFKYRLFSIEELKEVTNNFDQSTIIREGSRGKLYKGRLGNGTFVAIRCLTLQRKDSLRTLIIQLDLLSKLHHPNLVFLLGHCIDDSGQDTSPVKRAFLIYEYMSNGDLHSHLSENSLEKALKWPERLSVLIGIAKAVHFLHTGITPGFLNNRLRTKSILLDEHGIAKLSDYGLSIVTEEINKPEGKGERNKLRKKVKLEDDDVYSFGFILYETLVGSTSLEKGEAFRPNNMALLGSQDGQREMVEPIVLTTSCEESLSVVISIMNKCTLQEASIRPSFEDVLWNLQYAAQVQATSDGDQRLDISSLPASLGSQ